MHCPRCGCSYGPTDGVWECPECGWARRSRLPESAFPSPGEGGVHRPETTKDYYKRQHGIDFDSAPSPVRVREDEERVWKLWPTFVLSSTGDPGCVIEGPTIPPGETVEVVPREALDEARAERDRFEMELNEEREVHADTRSEANRLREALEAARVEIERLRDAHEARDELDRP
jgi:hypothetical protein